jgi:ectoine hydroxylase-related dioxygenase (phytanoyl-CoA dioxygenase family)
MADIDLSYFNYPLTDLFEQPKTPEEWAKYRLSNEQVAFFHEHGYLTNVKVLTEQQCDRFVAELPKTIDPSNPRHQYYYEFQNNESKDPNKVLFHCLGAWRVNPYFHDLLWSPAFRMAAYQLLEESPIRMFHDQVFGKPANHGGCVAWHQDFSYWTWTKPMQHLTCWLPIDNVTTENGCLWYVPHSHKWGLLPVTGLAADMDAVKTILTPEQNKEFAAKVPQAMTRGCASFHHPLTMHGSYENKTAAPRRALALNVFKDGTLSNWEARANEMLKNPKELMDFNKWGGKGWYHAKQDQPWVGHLFPILFDPAVELRKK